MKIKTGITALLMLLALGGCSSIMMDHPLIQKEPGSFATVYFIRPDTERSMGAADNRLVVELNQEPLLNLVKSEYTVLHLKPGEVDVTIKSLTIAGPFREFKKMQQSQRFEFEAGSTYYLSIEPVDGEFRGVYFLPRLIDLVSAKEISRFMRAVGPAKEAPIR